MALGGAAALIVPVLGRGMPRDLVDRLRHYCAKLAASGDLSGAIILAKDGRPLLRAAFGHRNRDLKLPNLVDTKFNIASIGKLFASLAIMRFAEAGRIALDSKLSACWPDYPNKAVANSITIAQLLTHTAGLGNRTNISPDRTLPPTATQTDVLKTFVNEPPDAPQGGAMSYSNDGYVVLGALIEHLSGKPYAEHCRETIFAPLGLKGTDLIPPGRLPPDAAHAYVRDLEHQGVWRDATETDGVPAGAAGGALSTVDDLVRFGEAMRQSQLLSPAFTRAWLQGRVDFRGGRYGYGTMEEVIGGHRIVGHSGGHYGIAGELMIFEDLGLTCAALTNGEVDAFWDLSNWIKSEIAGKNDRIRDYDFTRAIIDTFARSPAEGRALYAARGDRKARESVIDVFGLKFIHQGLSEQGLALLRFNVETFPDSSSALWSMAEALRIIGRRAEAVAAYRAYLAKEPGDADAERRIAELSGH